MIQVDKSHYKFSTYVSQARWVSYWYQIRSILECKPNNVLEIGPGPSIVKSILQTEGIEYFTVDPDEELNPDYIATATSIPIADNSFDVVCAFQMLEHLPYQESLIALREMARIASKYILISLPDARPCWTYTIYIPFVGLKKFLINRPFHKEKSHEFDGEHYWEICKDKYPLDRITGDIENVGTLMNTFRVFENPYHRFFIIEKK